MNYTIAGLVACLALAAGSAHADTRATQQRSLEKFTPYLKEPVEEFDYWSLYKWQLVGPEKIVVWTTIKDAYLLTVETPCPRLEWAHGLSLTSKQSHRIARHFDFVAVGHDRCRIEKIEPVDTRRMDAERKAAK